MAASRQRVNSGKSHYGYSSIAKQVKKKNAPTDKTKELPVFDLQTFSKKASWSDFYIQHLNDHISEHAFVERPHKHDFYLILFVEKGRGVHTIDFVEYPVTSKSIFLMTPGQVHSWTLSKDIDGFIVFFTRAFYEMQLSRNSLLEFPFYHSLVAAPVIQSANNAPLKFALHRMVEEFTHSDTPDRRMLRAYLDIFLLEAAKSYDNSYKVLTHSNTFKLRKLEQLIDENFRTLKKPSDYGELMNLAPSYLNSICKDSLGKTLTNIIQDRLLLEAKRMFAYSDINIDEVAAKLNFTDPSYFVRWFKKQTGNTPEEFRKTI